MDNYSRSKYGAIFDGHVHTYYDLNDGMISPKDLAQKTKQLGFNWITGMSHDTLKGLNKIKKHAKDVDLPVIPSIEISTGFNHILAYGIQEWNYAKDLWDPEIVIELLREQDCAIYLSHPAFKPLEWEWSPEIVKRLDIDGIEWFNGTNYWLNKKTQVWFKNWPKGKIAGSDAHHYSLMGYAFTQCPTTSEDPDDLVHDLQKGNCLPFGRNVPFPKFMMFVGYKLLRENLFHKFFFEGKWVIPHLTPQGKIPNQKFLGDKWKQRILRKPVITNFH